MFSAKLVTCHFKLQLASPIYYSGDQISGQIILILTKKLHLEGICLNLTCSERTQWSENANALSISYDDSSTHDARENKIDFRGSREYLMASMQLSEDIVLEPGEFVAKFSLNLPDQLLATCKQSNGSVDYHLKVVLQRKSMLHKTFRKRLFIRNRVDLNKEPDLAKPYITQCHVFNNDFIIVVPRKGFVPGQMVPFRIEMNQFSPNTKILIKLCQKISYSSQTPVPKTKEVVKVLDYVIVSSCNSGQLRVPFPTAISTALSNVLMEILYYLELIVLSAEHKVVQKTQLPITIGTVALRGCEKNSICDLQRLYSYDNPGAINVESDDCKQHKLLHFDFVSCESQARFNYRNKEFFTARKIILQKLCSMFFRKVVV